MDNFKVGYTLFLLSVITFSCNHEKIKVVHEEFSKDKPKIVYYFNNNDDTKQLPIVYVKDNGVSYASKPISFMEERYYENGKIQSRGNYLKGKSCGLWEYFYNTGIQQSRCYYLNGVTVDSVYCWYSSGKLRRHLVEIDKLKNYWHDIDYYENGCKAIECYMYKNSETDVWTIDGKWYQWYDNGQKKFYATIKNNWTINKWLQWEMKKATY